MAAALFLTESDNCDLSKISRIAERLRCLVWSAVVTRTNVADTPFFQTLSEEIVQPGTCRACSLERKSARSQPASTSAPSVISPLMPLKQSKYANFIGLRSRATNSLPSPDRFESIGGEIHCQMAENSVSASAARKYSIRI